jgi:hypothetical protein
MARLSSGDNLARLGRFGKSTSFVLETNECVIEAGREMLPCSILHSPRRNRRIVAKWRPTSGRNLC